ESSGRVGLAGDGSLRASYALTDDDADRLVYGIVPAAENHFAARAAEVYPHIAPAGTPPRKRLADFESTRFKPAELRLEAFHPMGTARIAPEGAGVCASDGSVHGTEALYVTDASLFPTSLGVNPMMTIVAFAARLARDLAKNAG